jgi:hypothetical protein
LPEPQLVQLADPIPAYSPGSHGEQVAEDGEPLNVPGEQLLHEELPELLYSPALQSAQVEDDDAPVDDEAVPALQLVHAAEEDNVAYLPGMQLVQAAEAVPVSELVKYLPGMQPVQLAAPLPEYSPESQSAQLVEDEDAE